MKSDFDAKMVWGESEMAKGGSKDVEPCAKAGCSPFPKCCTTNQIKDEYTGPDNYWTL